MMAIPNIDLFRKFENNIDELVTAATIRQAPVRVPYTSLYGIVAAAYAKNPKTGMPARPEAGAAIVSRMSYLLGPLSSCPLAPEGESALDAVQALDARGHQEMLLLLSFAHFCEIAPFAWKGYFSISGDERSLILSHASGEVAKSEVKDILLNLLTLPLSIAHPESDKQYFDRQVNTLPTVESEEMIRILAQYSEWFLRNSLECSPLSDAALQATVGISMMQFRKCRAAWLSIAEFHVQMGHAIRRRLENDPQKQDRIGKEYFEWIAPLLNAGFLEDFVRSASGISSQQYAALMEIYSFDPTNPRNGGEGFYPPFCRTSIGLLFSPYAVQRMLSSRNILYATLKSDQKRFDEITSPLLEPHLIDVARSIFCQLNDVEILLNHQWADGEFDMLIFRASENCVLHVQAKAALAPEGARMTARMESRVKEALSQLTRFKLLPQTQQDTILSGAFGRALKDVVVVDVVLCWASFGSQAIWEELEQRAPMNVSILANLVTRDKDLSLSNFVNLTHDLINEIVAAAAPVWEDGTLDFGESKVTVPNLIYRSDALVRYQLALHRLLRTD